MNQFLIRTLFVIALAFLHAGKTFPQASKNNRPLIIEGQLFNCPEKTLLMWSLDNHGISVADTITVDESGRFYLETTRITGPRQASIQRNRTQLNDLCVAPGYHLTITGDATDYQTLVKTVQIKGIGAASNRYKLLQDSLRVATNDTAKWYEMDKRSLLAYVDRQGNLKDSLMRVVFGRKATDDPYFNYFGRQARIDRMIQPMYYLLAHAEIRRFDADSTTAWLRSNFDKRILSNMYKKEYMVSEFYTTWIMGGVYLSYLVELDYQQDSTLRKDPLYKMKKVNAAYKGPIRDYVLHRLMRASISQAGTLQALDDCRSGFAPYLAVIRDREYQESIASEWAKRETELRRTEPGQPAPVFTLTSNTNTLHSLADFKGKVVYLDLWASWCGPCRAETPDFKELYEKYKDDKRVAFISIAVSDGEKEWRKALDEDQPGWLQLIDKDKMVLEAYAAKFIPKFILIDKQGRIADFNAPRPSEKEKIEQALANEMEK